LVEQRTENPCVPGSIPGGTTKKSEHLCSDFLFSKNFTQNNKIYDITGRILNKYTLKEGFNRVVTFLLSDGMYIFKYSYESSSKSQLVIKK
jgi:hypothetical protein